MHVKGAQDVIRGTWATNHDVGVRDESVPKTGRTLAANCAVLMSDVRESPEGVNGAAPFRGRRRLALVAISRAAGSSDAVLIGEHDQLGPVADLELGEQAADVGLGSCVADEQFGGDLSV